MHKFQKFPHLNSFFVGNTAAQAPREFLDCVAHIRLLSWLLLGSVNHTLRFSTGNDIVVSQPIPLEASCHIADHIQVILAGFAELSKTSVVHMCSLFHAFILCQLWTVYLEQIISLQPNNIPSGTTEYFRNRPVALGWNRYCNTYKYTVRIVISAIMIPHF